jgi:hypothetical protein
MATHGEPLKIIPQMLTQVLPPGCQDLFRNYLFFVETFATESPDTSVSDSSCGGVGALHGLLAACPELGAAPNGHDGESGYNEVDLSARADQVRPGGHRESNHDRSQRPCTFHCQTNVSNESPI